MIFFPFSRLSTLVKQNLQNPFASYNHEYHCTNLFNHNFNTSETRAFDAHKFGDFCQCQDIYNSLMRVSLIEN